LIASKLSDWPSLRTAPLTGRNSPPPGSAPRSLQQPGPERRGGIGARGADRQRKGRAEVERIEADFALDVPFRVEHQRDAAAQPRACNRTVQIVEAQPVARQRDARRQADVPRRRIRRPEIE
jgi:hypothetical protein